MTNLTNSEGSGRVTKLPEERGNREPASEKENAKSSVLREHRISKQPERTGLKRLKQRPDENGRRRQVGGVRLRKRGLGGVVVGHYEQGGE